MGATQGSPTARVSVALDGGSPDGESRDPELSLDGSSVVFVSEATNLVAGDTNGRRDVFLFDLAARTTVRVSVASDGTQANGPSDRPFLSSEGRFVAFRSRATDLVSRDTNGHSDVFVRDLRLGTTERVSVSTTGRQGNAEVDTVLISGDGRFVLFASRATTLDPRAPRRVMSIYVHDRRTGTTRLLRLGNHGRPNGDSHASWISPTGRFVGFRSHATNLVAGDTNGSSDAFVRDRRRGRTIRVSVSSSGAEGNQSSFRAQVSNAGRFAVFRSLASNLVPDDTNGTIDVFVRDVYRGRTSRVHVSSSGEQANARALLRPRISAAGRLVTFGSLASNLVRGDTNRSADIFVHDRSTGRTRRVSIGVNRRQANGDSSHARINADGRLVAFRSEASNLVPRDRNRASDIFVRALGPGPRAYAAARRERASSPAAVVVGTTGQFAAAVEQLGLSGGTIVLRRGRYSRLVVGPRSHRKLTIRAQPGASAGYVGLIDTRAVSLVGLRVTPRSSDAGVDVHGSRQVVLERLTVAGTRRYDAGIDLDRSRGVTIRDSSITRCGDGHLCVRTGHSSNVRILGNRFHDCFGCDFVRGRFARHLEIRGNSFQRALVGRCGTNPERCNHQDLVELHEGDGLIVEQNDFGVYQLPGGGQLALFGPLANVVIRNNVFRHSDPRAPGVDAHVGINLGGFTGLPRRVLIANNTVLSGDERRGRHHTSIRLKPAYRSMAAANRPVIANNILHVARRPSLCAGARVVKSNVIMDGVACSAGDVVGDPLLDRRGRPTAESALVIDRASRTWAPRRDLTGRRRDASPDIGAYEYFPP
jgi:Tol biopolymer transport system component